jgi:hypothetical protein
MSLVATGNTTAITAKNEHRATQIYRYSVFLSNGAANINHLTKSAKATTLIIELTTGFTPNCVRPSHKARRPTTAQKALLTMTSALLRTMTITLRVQLAHFYLLSLKGVPATRFLACG